MGIIIVEICESNLISVIDLEHLLETQYPEVAVLVNSCLSFCGMCARRPFAIVNGKRIFAKTTDECLSLIKSHIESELAAFTD